MPRGISVSTRQINEIVRLKREGKNNAQIADALHVSTVTIGRYLKQQGIKSDHAPKKKLTREEKDRLDQEFFMPKADKHCLEVTTHLIRDTIPTLKSKQPKRKHDVVITGQMIVLVGEVCQFTIDTSAKKVIIELVGQPPFEVDTDSYDLLLDDLLSFNLRLPDLLAKRITFNLE